MKPGQSRCVYSGKPRVSVARCRGDDSCVGGYDMDNDAESIKMILLNDYELQRREIYIQQLGQGSKEFTSSSVSRVGVGLGDSARSFTVDGKMIEST